MARARVDAENATRDRIVAGLRTHRHAVSDDYQRVLATVIDPDLPKVDIVPVAGSYRDIKGLLVSTSGFSRATYAWAGPKPLQLITGTEQLGLCREHDIPARILHPTRS